MTKTPDHQAANQILEYTIERLEVNLANARIEIQALEDEILDCPATNYHAPDLSAEEKHQVKYD